MSCIEADVVVLGAGPAGCALALNLAPFQRVLLVDKGESPGVRIGESLPAAAGRLLRDMGLHDDFVRQGHLPCHVSRSAWGGGLFEQDAIRNLDGPGWHLDRARFDAWLLQVAQARGAALLRQTRLLAVGRPHDSTQPWRLDVERMGRPLQLAARCVVDASGRNSSLAKQLGSRRIASGKLVCGWLLGRDRIDAGGASDLHVEPDGWWYTSPLPGGARLLAFYTDADLPAAAAAHSREGMLARLPGVPGLLSYLEQQGFCADRGHGFCAAHGAVLERACGAGWLAVGDAALSFDPLSAQGLFNALYTGLAGAEAAQRHLQGDQGALPGYQAQLHAIERAYASHLDACYRQEQRWPDRPFWRRRQAQRCLTP
jgi:flavin-dependent dehydrogenase